MDCEKGSKTFKIIKVVGILGKPVFMQALLFVVVFLIFLKPATDPDFGWHLQTGRFILQNHRVPTENLYSYNFPNFQYTDFYWIPQVIFAFVTDHFGLFALSCFCSLVMTLAVFVSAVRKSGTGYLLAILLVAILISPIAGVRPLVFGSLFFAIAINLLRKLFLKKSKVSDLFLFFFLFCLSANFYGDFLFCILLIMGISFIGFLLNFLPKDFLCYMLRNLKAQRIEKELLLVKEKKFFFFYLAAVSFLGTLLTPNGLLLWQSILVNVTSIQKIAIAEWLPLWLPNGTTAFFAFFVSLSFVLLWLKRENVSLIDFLLIIVFSIGSARSIFFSRLLGLSSLSFLAGNLRVDSFIDRPLKLNISSYKVKIAWISFLILLIFGLTPKVFDAYAGAMDLKFLANKENYPYDSVEFLKSNPQSGNIFNDYGWGGYLIWNLPKVKTFIDGGMGPWKEGETEILRDYTILHNAQPGFSKLLKKYNISWVLLKPEAPLANLLRENKNWEVKYEDDVSIIIVRE